MVWRNVSVHAVASVSSASSFHQSRRRHNRYSLTRPPGLAGFADRQRSSSGRWNLEAQAHWVEVGGRTGRWLCRTRWGLEPGRKGFATQASTTANATGHVTDHATRLPPRRRKRAWDDVPLRPKLGLLLALSATAGIGLGVVSQHTEHSVPVILGGLSVLACALLMLAHAWVQGPVDRLVRWLDVQSRAETPLAIKNLPIERQDEIGRMAKAIYQIALTATRNHYDAQQLRRTLDHRVKAATAKATTQLRSEANRDPLTQLGNRRLLDEELDPLVGAARQSGTDLVCIMFDMDRFKQVNDHLGHGVGDEMLQLLAALLRSSIRHDDLAIRLGGDEFVVLMPGGTLERAVELADVTRTLFRQQSRASIGESGLRPDLSIGVASLNQTSAADGKALLEKADAALYQAKDAGRGRTVALSA